jgi:hypothetical protein
LDGVDSIEGEAMFAIERKKAKQRAVSSRTAAIESLEGRSLLAALGESEPNDSLGSSQRLEGDTSYEVSGAISSLVDVDYYSFRATSDSSLSFNARALNPDSAPSAQFDPVIGLFDPSGNLVAIDDDGGFGSYWASGLSWDATESGIWTIAISDYYDFDFDGIGGDGDGFGTDTGSYILSVQGAESGFNISQLSTNTFVITDSITLTASMGAPNAEVRWTVEGRGAASGITGFPADAVTVSDAEGNATFTFTPLDNPNLVSNRRTAWTEGSYVPNDAISFEVIARTVVDGTTLVSRLSDRPALGALEQDEIDRLRQEYFDYSIPVPTRAQVVPTIPGGFNVGNYSVQISDGLDTRYNAILAAYRGRQATVVIDGVTYQTIIPLRTATEITSFGLAA